MRLSRLNVVGPLLLGITLLACEDEPFSSERDDECATVGPCLRSLAARGDVAATLADLKEGTAETCQGTSCRTATLALYNESQPANAFLRCEGVVTCRLDPTDAGLRVTFDDFASTPPSDGESFTFRVTKKDGTRLLDVTKPVTFVRSTGQCGCSNISADVPLP